MAGEAVNSKEEPCRECQAIFDHWYDRDDWKSKQPGFLHKNIVELTDAARNGCPVCSLFLQDLEDDSINSLKQDFSSLRGSIVVDLTYIGTTNEIYSITIGFDTYAKATIEIFRSDTDSRLKPGKPQKTVDCGENWKLVKRWLNSCKEHPTCSMRLFERRLPTRLVDVGESDKNVRLCLTNELPEHVEYLTLSHCWGGKVFTTLRRENLENFAAHIPSKTLSKTFRDAFVSVRKLGFKYIWIDSLCIIQGDEVDWKRESALMGHIYANSTLNLAALDSPDGSFGLFLERKPGPQIGCQIHAYCKNGSNSTSTWYCAVSSMSYKLTNGVLKSRAWVYQELLLAPRSLYFGAKELAFDCRQSKACETFPGSYSDGLLTIAGLIESGLWKSPDITIARKWNSLITNYSDGSLTFSRDKLIAIAGLARMFTTKFDTNYLAGMWKENLIEQLLWYTFKKEVGYSPIPYRAPSWSWAAINTGTYVETIRPSSSHLLVSVLEVTTSLTTADLYGEVTGGYLQLKCQFPCVGSVIASVTDYCLNIRSKAGDWTALVFFDWYPYFVEGDIYFLPIVECSNRKGNPQLDGLVLKYVDEKDHYYRVGMFKILRQENIELFKDIQRGGWDDPKSIFKSERTGADNDGIEMCIITIV